MIYEIDMNSSKLSTPTSSLTLYPKRGWIITSLKFWDTEILYQDMLEETLHDEAKSVRGWIPILFPQAWPITDEEAKILWYSLPQHGVVRQRAWEWKKTDENTFWLVYSQKNNESEFPYTFSLENTISLQDDSCKLSFTLSNQDKNPIPYAHGYHPYFTIPQWDKNDITWDERYSKEMTEQASIWQNDGTISLETQDEYFDFHIAGLPKIRLNFSPEIKNIWIWSLLGKNFVCIEPVCWNEWILTKKPYLLPEWENTNFFFEIQAV